MNVEFELLEKRTARLKVAIEEDVLAKAKRSAARRLAKQINIPGFRKGKAPYNIVLRYLGEGAILEEAIEKIGPDLYVQALEEAGLEPYGPGQFENVETEPELTLVFTLPLQPVVDLGNYRDIRLEFETPEVSDEMVDRAMKFIQNSRAIVEAKDGPAEMGDEIELLVYGVLLPQEDDVAATDEADTSEDDSPDVQVLFDDEELKFILDEEREQPAPGFFEALSGMEAGDERDFTLTFPDDPESEYLDSLLGRTARFQVECLGVYSRHVHPLNDDFAQMVTEGKTETLLELRIEVRNDLAMQLSKQAEDEYASQVLDKLVEQATFDYPDSLIEDYIDEIVAQFRQRLQRESIDLDEYLRLNQMNEADLREEFQESAIKRAKRALVLGEILNQEHLSVDNAEVDEDIAQRVQMFSNDNEVLRTALQEVLNTQERREDIAMSLLTQRAFDRLVEIAKGQAPPLEEDQGEDSEEEADSPLPQTTEEATNDAVEGTTTAQ